MTTHHDFSNSPLQGTSPRQANRLPAAAYDQLVEFAKSYSGRMNAAPQRAFNEGERNAELVHIIFRITKGDVRVRLGVLADKLGVRRRRLSASFRRLYNTNPKEYQLRIRIDWVCNAMSQDPTRKIESVAAEVGYTDLADFNHSFRRHVGVSPQTYQERAKAASKEGTF